MRTRKSSFSEGLKNPHAYVIVFSLILIATLLTWIIPAGEFDRVIDPHSERSVVDPESFRFVEKQPVSLFKMLQAIPAGIAASSGIIAFIFIISGSVHVIRSTGAIDAAILYLIHKVKLQDWLLLSFIVVLFSMMGAVFGFAEETIPFIPLGVALALGLGYDRVVGFHIVRTAAWIGFAGAFLNPFTIGVAQSMAELPLFSGIGLRIISYIIFLLIGLWFILRYANRVKEDPSKSIVHEYVGEKDPADFVLKDVQELSGRHKLVLLLFAVNIGLLVFGVLKYEWYTRELSALFLGFAIIIGIVGGMSPNQLAREFSKGMAGVTFGALVVGFARAIVLILQDGMVLDTIVLGMAQPVIGMGSSIALVGMFLIQSLINFFIGSGSGQAAATMPIMIPLSDIIGVTRQSAVLAFQFGDGITNMLWPSMIYYLAFADIPYNKWFGHIAKLVIILTLAGCVLVAISGMINYGPF
jgi:uncharacterized ion transporter superfamily protein YfcC